MKIVDYETFLGLGEGILYRTTKPMYFGDLNIKYGTLSTDDWVLQSFEPMFEEYFPLQDAYEKLEDGESLTLDLEVGERDAMYDRDRKFLIYEEKDIRILIEKLQTLLK